MIQRTTYLNKVIPLIDKKIIKVITGVRRCGKTVLLTQIRDHLLTHGRDEEQIVYISFESIKNKKYRDGDFFTTIFSPGITKSAKNLYSAG